MTPNGTVPDSCLCTLADGQVPRLVVPRQRCDLQAVQASRGSYRGYTCADAWQGQWRMGEGSV